MKHSGAREVCLALTSSAAGFGLTIRDNGGGFDINNLAGHGNGLVNMRKRIEEVGGNFKIDSSQGKGTTVEIVFRPTG